MRLHAPYHPSQTLGSGRAPKGKKVMLLPWMCTGNGTCGSKQVSLLFLASCTNCAVTSCVDGFVVLSNTHGMMVVMNATLLLR
jgi:hypothetical protein